MSSINCIHSIPADRLFTDRYAILRIKEFILTIKDDTPVLLTFDDAKATIEAMAGDNPHERAKRTGNLSVLERSMPKLLPYQASDNPGNRILSETKQQAVLHRAMWVKNLETLKDDWEAPRYHKYISEQDLSAWPALKDLVADPDHQYRDPRSERCGHVMLKTECIQQVLGWSEEIQQGIDPEKMHNRQAISARLELVPWMELPDEIELIMLTDDEATKRFGEVPDGIIPMTLGAMDSVRAMSRNGHPSTLKNGDKLRGGTILPFKGTIRRIPGSKPQMYLVEDGALKIKLTGNIARMIKVTREQILDGAFGLETPSQERFIRNPKFGTHMMNLLIGQLRANHPVLADSLVPRIPKRLIHLASGKGDTIEYVDLCIHPVKGYSLDRNLALDVCSQILSGQLVVPIEDGIITVPGADEFSHYQFGITTAGRLMLRGIPPTYEMVWRQLMPRISSEIKNQLRPRVRGVGGMAQADASLPLGTVRVSRKIGGRLRAEIATIMYWPSKFPHCLHKVKVEVDNNLDGSVIVVHPDVMDTLGGDCDGDLIYLITEPSIVRVSRLITAPVTIRDRLIGAEITYPNIIEMVRAERYNASAFIDKIREVLTDKDESDGHQRMAKVNKSADNIGIAFVARDLIMDAVGYDDDRTYVRLGMLCQEALDGLKVSTPVDIVDIILQDPMKLSTYLRVPVEDLPYDEGVSVWNRKGRIRSMYGALNNKQTSLFQVVGASKAAKTNASSLFEWILARTDIDKVKLPKIISSYQLKETATQLINHVPASDVKKTRYELVRSKTMTVCEDGHYIPIDGQDFVSLEDYRYGRVRYLMEQGISAEVLRAVVLDHVSRYPNAVEALGLLTEVKSMRAAGHCLPTMPHGPIAGKRKPDGV